MINENPNSVLSWTQYYETVSHEFSGSDVTVSDVLQAFYGIMVGAGFGHNCVLEAMKNFAEERLEISENN